MISEDKIRSLAALMEETGLTGLEINPDDGSVRLERATAPAVAAAPVAAPAASASATAPAVQAVASGTPVKSPMVGVFYAAPSPDAKPYVSVGDKVKKGQVLCIVEAMKLMNEILAETDGTVTQICVENAQVVEFGDPIMYLS